jgi:hypothetical protein
MRNFLGFPKGLRSYRPAWIFRSLLSLLVATAALSQAPRNLQVVDLAADSSPEAVEQAHAAFSAGNTILRVTSGSPDEIRRLIGVSLGAAEVNVTTTGGTPSDAEPSKSTLRAAVAYKDRNGAIRSAVVYSPNEWQGQSVNRWTDSLNAWIEREQLQQSGVSSEGAEPEPPHDAWTALYRSTIIATASSPLPYFE